MDPAALDQQPRDTAPGQIGQDAVEPRASTTSAAPLSLSLVPLLPLTRHNSPAPRLP